MLEDSDFANVNIVLILLVLLNIFFYYSLASPMPVNHRPDLASSMHVAAATGQPLMAPAPMAGHQIFYPPHGAMIPGTPQPYTQVHKKMPSTSTPY